VSWPLLLQLFAGAGIGAPTEVDPDKAVHVEMGDSVLAALNKGDLDTALELADLFIDHAGTEHPDDAVLLSSALSLRGVSLLTDGQYYEALDVFLYSLRIEIDAVGPTDPSLGTTYNNLGTALANLGDYEPARVAFERAVDLQARGGNGGNALYNLASTDLAVGDYDQAVARFEAILADIEARGGDPKNEATVLLQLGSSYATMGQHRKARELLERSRDLRAEIYGPRSAQVSAPISALAGLVGDLGDLETAHELQSLAVAIIEEQFGPDHFRLAAPLNNLAALEKVLGNVEGALGHYERSAVINRGYFGEDSGDLAINYSNMARNYIVLGDVDKAEEYVGKALEILERGDADHPYVASALDTASLVARLRGNVVEALTAARRALAIENRSGNQLEAAKMQVAIAHLLAAAGREDEAVDAAAAALGKFQRMADSLLGSMSDRERLRFLWHSSEGLDAYLTVGGDLRVEDQHEAVLRWKGMAGAALAASRGAAHESADPAVAALTSQLAEVSAAVSARTLDPSLDPASRKDAVAALIRDKDAIERELDQKTQAAVATRLGPGLDRHRVCARLAVGSVLVDYVRYSKMNLETWENRYHYSAFVLGQRDCSVERVDIGEASQLETAVADYQARMGSSSAARLDNAGQALRRLLWDPLGEDVTNSKKVYVVPDGAVAQVAFGALPDGDGGYLLEAHRFGYLERAGSLVAPASESRGHGAVVVGGLDYGKATDSEEWCVPPTFDRLPATLDEAERVHKLLGRKMREPASLLVGSEVDQTVIATALGESPRILHLATHGFHLGVECTGGKDGEYVSNPMAWSGLALAGANEGPEGIWTAEEVGALNLSGTELVVLSACDTGRGHAIGGEGVLGLRRGFAAAGAETVVMSLWAVEDEATKELMTDMYGQMTRGRGVAAIDALHIAQLNLLASNRRKFGHGLPSTWGAFIGAGRWP